MRNYEVRYPVQGANALNPHIEDRESRCGVIIPFPGNHSSLPNDLENQEDRSFNHATYAQSAIAVAAFTIVAVLAVLFL